MSTLEDMLNTPLDAIEAPKPVPPGSYRAMVTDFKTTKSTQKGTDGYEFTFRLLEPQDDVDPELLAAYRDGGSDIAGKEMSYTQWLTSNSLFMFKEFLTNLGIEHAGRTLAAAIDEAKGREAVVEIVNAISKTSDRPYASIKAVRPL